MSPAWIRIPSRAHADPAYVLLKTPVRIANGGTSFHTRSPIDLCRPGFWARISKRSGRSTNHLFDVRYETLGRNVRRAKYADPICCRQPGSSGTKRGLHPPAHPSICLESAVCLACKTQITCRVICGCRGEAKGDRALLTGMLRAAGVPAAANSRSIELLSDSRCRGGLPSVGLP